MSNTALKLAVQLQKQFLRQAHQERQQKERERKARARALIETGALVAKAGLHDLTEEEKLGAFIEAAERAKKDPSLRTAWARKGAMILNPPPPAKRPVEVQFAGRPASTDGLKKLGLKYNGVRRCWKGIVCPKAAGQLAASLGGQFRLLDQQATEVEEEVIEIPSPVPAGSK